MRGRAVWAEGIEYSEKSDVFSGLMGSNAEEADCAWIPTSLLDLSGVLEFYLPCRGPFLPSALRGE